jgi:hypothetical protein
MFLTLSPTPTLLRLVNFLIFASKKFKDSSLNEPGTYLLFLIFVISEIPIDGKKYFKGSKNPFLHEICIKDIFFIFYEYFKSFFILVFCEHWDFIKIKSFVLNYIFKIQLNLQR